jgi:rhodanese-related sulfurtransferase
VPLDKPVIVYCNTGERSAAAAFVLTRAGYSQVSAMHGGLSAMLRLIAQQQAAAAG